MRIISLFLFTILLSVTSFSQETEKIDYLLKGDTLPEFNIETLDGQKLKSSDLKDKTTVLVFFATWCPPCRKELPHVQKEIWEKFKSNKDFQLFVIGREHTVEEMKKFKEENGFTFPMVADTNRDIFKLFAKQNIPRTYIINPNGKIEVAKTGFDLDSFRKDIKIIDQLLAK